ncbi:TPA: ribbon-helix-helix protein, CopG family [Candidatus Woesearchaeota archaeon]|nr:ribbon-helix-helix protein, CopG family [Candidatus Woesearchaeota archaeon]
MKLGVSVSIEESTLEKLRELLRKRRYRNKSHAVEEAILRMHEYELGQEIERMEPATSEDEEKGVER